MNHAGSSWTQHVQNGSVLNSVIRAEPRYFVQFRGSYAGLFYWSYQDTVISRCISAEQGQQKWNIRDLYERQRGLAKAAGACVFCGIKVK